MARDTTDPYTNWHGDSHIALRTHVRRRLPSLTMPRQTRKWELQVRAALMMSWCVVLAGFATVAHTVTFQLRTFEELVARAEKIFVGTVVGSAARRTLSGAIVTDYAFDVIQVAKGDLTSSATVVTFLGGSIDDESYTVLGGPQFRHGETYVVFVTENGKTMFPVVGGTQGIFQVRSVSPQERSKVFTYGGLPLVATPAGATITQSAPPSQLATRIPDSRSDSLALDEFIELIRRQLGR